MKKIIFTCLLTLVSITYKYAFSQNIHSPGELLKIIENSKVNYELRDLKDSIRISNYTSNLNSNNAYRIKDKEDKIQLMYFQPNAQIDSLLKTAEKSIINKNIKSAREAYMQIIKINPSYYQVYTYIGQTYSIEGKYKKAQQWYKNAIKNNYIDYMAHWFLADILYQDNKTEEAKKEIVIAKILNRNNPRIDISFNKICFSNNSYQNWLFNPQINILNDNKDKVLIYFKPEWLGYAIGKALWKYEPGYKESMGINQEAYSTIEEKECLLSLIANLQNNQEYIKSNPYFEVLLKAFENKMIDEFIFFEIVLVEYPYIAYQLPDAFIDKIANYVINVRNKR